MKMTRNNYSPMDRDKVGQKSSWERDWRDQGPDERWMADDLESREAAGLEILSA